VESACALWRAITPCGERLRLAWDACWYAARAHSGTVATHALRGRHWPLDRGIIATVRPRRGFGVKHGHDGSSRAGQPRREHPSDGGPGVRWAHLRRRGGSYSRLDRKSAVSWRLRGGCEGVGRVASAVPWPGAGGSCEDAVQGGGQTEQRQCCTCCAGPPG
jgi:hypothetical protein